MADLAKLVFALLVGRENSMNGIVVKPPVKGFGTSEYYSTACMYPYP